MKPTRIIIIAKAPIPGFCKTRLAPAIGTEAAARLARRMLRDAVNSACSANVGPVELCVTPGVDAFDWASLGLPASVEWSEQGDGDLGERMGGAAQRTVAAGEAVLLIGTDCPGLDAAVLRNATAALSDHDAAMVPTADGGYALLGLARFDALVFADMPWSTDAVATLTRQRLQQLGWSLHTLPTLHDIDEPADLRHLPARWQAELPSSYPSEPSCA
ncbi:TIGR04282 family arsenosugar biosynthesis glycosyltransferase [Acidovorax sp. BL-A-41-H1]|uniref:TIGR04282 family arsenosugar biosynthesis glycosyltransferase n=1 Tax=Acidovorax sp. BL-A-41-H1 TaxID=3421102 RepID=UPI003F79BD03